MEKYEYLRGKINQCRRLARATLDPRTAAELSALAAELEARAKVIEPSARSPMAEGRPGRSAPDAE